MTASRKASAATAADCIDAYRKQVGRGIGTTRYHVRSRGRTGRGMGGHGHPGGVREATNRRVGADGAMRIMICGDAAEATAAAASEIVGSIRGNPSAVLGLATGGTMEPLYAALVAEHHAGHLSFAKVTTFNLDEYVGLEPEHPATYRYFMRQHLFDRVDIDLANTYLPHGCGDLDTECQRYEEAIAAAGGIDLQLLGIGTDGHIGFNEPGSSLGSRTRVKTLARQTRRDNARFFPSPDAVPQTAVTMGVATILDAREILLLATGRGKADAVAAAVEGPITAAITASALQLHPRVTFVLDTDAAAALRYADDYRAAEEQRQIMEHSPRP